MCELPLERPYMTLMVEAAGRPVPTIFRRAGDEGVEHDTYFDDEEDEQFEDDDDDDDFADEEEDDFLDDEDEEDDEDVF